MPTSDSKMEAAKRLMVALVRMPPKPHEEMKVGKSAAVAKTQRKKKKPK